MKNKVNQKDAAKGKFEKTFDKSLEDLGMATQRYFAGDAMVGNVCKRGYKSPNNGEETLVKCLEDQPEEQNNFLSAFRSLGKIHNLFFTEHPSEEESEMSARECESFLKNYPIWFPKLSITRL